MLGSEAVRTPYDQLVVDAITLAIPAMNIHAKEGQPEEVVGMILSDGSIVRLINQLRSPYMFSVSRAQLADRLARIDPEIHTVAALYHSHPAGTSTLSPTDITEMRRSWTDDGLTLPWVVVCPDSRIGFWWLDPRFSQPQSVVIRMEHQEPALV